ncbi:hypothetical protein [Geobacter sp.]|uniref:hypothetical protein n=1 Tax=Geobacter sp. TaxID=46610 RepID=UPI0027B8F554|nr:hypothetical protein [Geobacter sp.]
MTQTTFRRLAASLTLLIPVAAGAAETQAVTPLQQAKLNAILNGSYAFTASRTCVQTPCAPGFDRANRKLLADGETVGFVESGTLTFSGTGLVKGTDITVAVIEPAKAIADSIPMQNGIKSSCTGTYTVNADRSYTTNLACTAQVGGGVSLTISPAVYRGSSDPFLNMLTISETDGGIQTVEIFYGSYPTGQTFERVCTSSGTLVRTGR